VDHNYDIALIYSTWKAARNFWIAYHTGNLFVWKMLTYIYFNVGLFYFSVSLSS